MNDLTEIKLMVLGTSLIVVWLVWITVKSLGSRLLAGLLSLERRLDQQDRVIGRIDQRMARVVGLVPGPPRLAGRFGQQRGSDN